MPVVQDLADMYKAVDAAATVNLLAKLAVEKSYHAKLDDTRSSLAVCFCYCTCIDPARTHAHMMSPHRHKQILLHTHKQCHHVCINSVGLGQSGRSTSELLPVGPKMSW